MVDDVLVSLHPQFLDLFVRVSRQKFTVWAQLRLVFRLAAEDFPHNAWSDCSLPGKFVPKPKISAAKRARGPTRLRTQRPRSDPRKGIRSRTPSVRDLTKCSAIPENASVQSPFPSALFAYAGRITSSWIRLSSRLHEPSVQFSIWARAWMMVPL